MKTIRMRFVYLILLIAAAMTTSLLADITGNIYQDYRSDGIKNDGDIGIAGVTLSAYDTTGTQVATTTTLVDGNYTLSVAAGTYRIEITPPSGLYASSALAPLVNNISNGAVYNVGLNKNANYCQAGAKQAMTAMIQGDNGDTNATIFVTPEIGNAPTATGPHAVSGTIGTHFNGLVLGPTTNHPDIFIDQRTDTWDGDHDIQSWREEMAHGTETGKSIWGLAWQKSQRKLYSAAVIRRHALLRDNDGDGIGDAGAIYVTDVDTNTTSLLTIVPDVGYSQIEASRDMNVSDPASDASTISLMGRAGLGDLDISEDETMLYTVNLHTKELIAIPIATPDTQTATAIPNPYDAGTCPDADVRPWAVKVKDQDIYVGSVCESDITLGARVQKYDTVSGSFATIAKTNTLKYQAACQRAVEARLIAEGVAGLDRAALIAAAEPFDPLGR